MMRPILDRLGKLESALRKNKAVNVNASSIKEMATDLASFYFADSRPALVRSIGETADLRAFDETWQDLVRLAHGNNATSSYRRVVRSLKKAASEINIAGLSRPIDVAGQTSTAIEFSPAEQILIKTLEDYVPSAAASYRQGILDLDPNLERVSYRGSATEFREALRETVDHLAPDSEVMTEPGYRNEQNQTKPTMKQKVRFVLKSRARKKTQRETTEKSIDLIESLCGEVVRAVYNRASLSTHVETTRSEVLQIKRYVDTVLFDLLEISER